MAGKRKTETDAVTQVKETTSLEELFEKLEEVIAKMECADVTLEQSFTFYNEGMQLLRQCGEAIDTVEKKVQILDENGDAHEF